MTNLPPPVHQAPPSNPNDTVTSNHFKLSETFLQILLVIITSGTKIVHTNALPDAGSNVTLISEHAKFTTRKQGIRNTKRPS